MKDTVSLKYIFLPYKFAKPLSAAANTAARLMHNAARRGGGLRPDMDEPQILRLVEPQSSRPPQISEAAPRPQRLAHPLSTTRGGRGYTWIRLGGGGGAGLASYTT